MLNVTSKSENETFQLHEFVSLTTGRPDVEYDLYVTLVCWRLRYDFGRLKLKTMYEKEASRQNVKLA